MPAGPHPIQHPSSHIACCLTGTFWNISFSFQSGSGNAAAQEAISRSHPGGKLSTRPTSHAPFYNLSSGSFQTGYRVPVKEQSPRSKPVWIQKRSLHRNSPVVCNGGLKNKIGRAHV